MKTKTLQLKKGVKYFVYGKGEIPEWVNEGYEKLADGVVMLKSDNFQNFLGLSEVCFFEEVETEQESYNIKYITKEELENYADSLKNKEISISEKAVLQSEINGLKEKNKKLEEMVEFPKYFENEVHKINGLKEENIRLKESIDRQYDIIHELNKQESVIKYLETRIEKLIKGDLKCF